jgi:hypothetical protein
VPVLDTQEFYSGVTTPISGQLFDYFINEEYPREEIFSLFVEKIIVRRDALECSNPPNHGWRCELAFVNYPGNDIDFDLSQVMIEHLLNLGITTEAIEAPKKPTGDAGAGTAAPAAAGAAGSSSATSSDTSTKTEFRFCFAPRREPYISEIIDNRALCGFKKKTTAAKPNVTTTTTHKQITTNEDEKGHSVTRLEGLTIAKSSGSTSADEGGISKRALVTGVRLSDAFIRNLETVSDEHQQGPSTELKSSLRAFRQSKVTFSIYTRSTEGILYFLGEVVRRNLYPETNPARRLEPRIYQIKLEKSFYRHFPERPCDEIGEKYKDTDEYRCQPMFVLDAGSSTDLLALSIDYNIDYNGRGYSVPADPERAGKTLHVLSIVKELLALNTSAKSLPQTNVISVISP